MLKPKKRKIRTQVTMREHDFVVYAPQAKARVVPNDEVRERIMPEWVIGRPHSLPHLSRQIRLIAQRRFSKATIGVVGLHPISKEEWDTHWAWKRLTKTAKESQLRQHLSRGHLSSGLLLTSEIRRQTSQPAPGIIEEILRRPRQVDSLIAWDAGLQEPGMRETMMQIVKGRKPGLGTLFQNGIGDSPRLNPSERKSDIEMTLAMQQGPDAVRELYLQRYGITGADGKRYLLDTEYYDPERAEALLKMVLGSEAKDEEVSDSAVRTFRKALNHAKVGAFGDTPWRPTVDGIEGFVKSTEMAPIEFDSKIIRGADKE